MLNEIVNIYYHISKKDECIINHLPVSYVHGRQESTGASIAGTAKIRLLQVNV
jgi:hypothetical protein